ncbi:aminotransferase class V-fold PLP-dependent enzyme [Salipiger mangrovisoli]|uniref:Aminotransferase class V-fold PLP-dependent enzyme n=1 Tax=Salipiger mangrovisoli TaxID=2865933 RepID=A0ABR9X420_9RHOB|nr:aminotransferase class V-fold PLP-dependent enzyme [Salipiger mangrovisoli]MBE9638338.1 aminotransferase class V-fold PLP-dependent enzyme [Salipiger mangrovisoli]
MSPAARLINAAGTLTRLSGAPLAPGVLEAMIAAERFAVDMVELHADAGARIAGATGAESGLVTAGASAGLLLAAAACLARDDVARMNALPRTGPLREIVVARSQRNGYDHALRTAGARLVEVGLPDPAAGAGTRDAEPWEYAAALGPRSAALLFVARPGNHDALAEVAAVARAHAVPIIVDAAAELPPAANLRRFLADGADLVVFSGGKLLGGPAGTGMLAGRRDLVASAALQCLDLDLPISEFSPPAGFIDMSRYRGLPRHGVGRAAKLGKHEIAGLMAALDHFLSVSDAQRHAHWLSVCDRIADALPEPRIRVVNRDNPDRIPLLEIDFSSPAKACEMDCRLRTLSPPVHLAKTPRAPSSLVLNPVCLRNEDIAVVRTALRAVLPRPWDT